MGTDYIDRECYLQEYGEYKIEKQLIKEKYVKEAINAVLLLIHNGFSPDEYVKYYRECKNG